MIELVVPGSGQLTLVTAGNPLVSHVSCPASLVLLMMNAASLSSGHEESMSAKARSPSWE